MTPLVLGASKMCEVLGSEAFDKNEIEMNVFALSAYAYQERAEIDAKWLVLAAVSATAAPRLVTAFDRYKENEAKRRSGFGPVRLQTAEEKLHATEPVQAAT